MTFAVHRSAEPTEPSAVKRSAARRRRHPHTIARLPADVRRATASNDPGARSSSRSTRGDRRDRPRARTSTRTSSARSTPAPRSSAAPTSAASSRGGACWPRTGTGTRTCRARTRDLDRRARGRLVRDADRGRHAGQDRPQQRGPRRLPEHPPHDRRRRHWTAPRSTSCCAASLADCQTVDEAIELLTAATRDRLLRGDRGHARRRRAASSSRPAARTSSAAASAPTPTTSSSRRQARPGHDADRVPDARSRAWRPSAASRCSTRCADHDGQPKGVCRHVDASEPWVEQTVTVASVVMNLAAAAFTWRRARPAPTSTSRSRAVATSSTARIDSAR